MVLEICSFVDGVDLAAFAVQVVIAKLLFSTGPNIRHHQTVSPQKLRISSWSIWPPLRVSVSLNLINHSFQRPDLSQRDSALLAKQQSTPIALPHSHLAQDIMRICHPLPFRQRRNRGTPHIKLQRRAAPVQCRTRTKRAPKIRRQGSILPFLFTIHQPHIHALDVKALRVDLALTLIQRIFRLPQFHSLERPHLMPITTNNVSPHDGALHTHAAQRACVAAWVPIMGLLEATQFAVGEVL
jgi:hypothetical protein